MSGFWITLQKYKIKIIFLIPKTEYATFLTLISCTIQNHQRSQRENYKKNLIKRVQ